MVIVHVIIMVMRQIMMPSLSGFIYHVPFKKYIYMYMYRVYGYDNDEIAIRHQKKKKKINQILYNKYNATYNILINHLYNRSR